MVDLNSAGFIVATAMLAALLLVALAAFVHQWRRMHKRNSACPPDVPCTSRADDESDQEDGEDEDVMVTEEVIPLPMDPEVLGYVRCPRGAPCDLWGGHDHDHDHDHDRERGHEKYLTVTDNAQPRAALHSATGVVELATMEEVVRATRQPRSVMLMYSANCGHCTAMKPAYASAAAQAGCPFYAVDALHVPSIVETYKLAGFPTVFKFEQGRMVAEYSGDRSAPDLLLFSQ